MKNIKELKNDKERIAFLEDYRNLENGWYLWKDYKDINRRMWRLPLADDVAFVVEEQLRTYKWPNVHTTWFVMHWYIIENQDVIFGDCVASRSLALAKLKEVQKR